MCDMLAAIASIDSDAAPRSIFCLLPCEVSNNIESLPKLTMSVQGRTVAPKHHAVLYCVFHKLLLCPQRLANPLLHCSSALDTLKFSALLHLTPELK